MRTKLCNEPKGGAISRKNWPAEAVRTMPAPAGCMEGGTVIRYKGKNEGMDREVQRVQALSEGRAKSVVSHEANGIER